MAQHFGYRHRTVAGDHSFHVLFREAFATAITGFRVGLDCLTFGIDKQAITIVGPPPITLERIIDQGLSERLTVLLHIPIVPTRRSYR